MEGVHTCMGSPTPRSPPAPRRLRRQAVLPSTYSTVSALRTCALSALDIPARMHRYRRFSPGLTADAARLAEKRGRLLLSFRGTLTRYPSPVSLALRISALLDRHRQLLARYAAGERDFAGADLRRLDLRCKRLAGARLVQADLTGSELTCADLSNANLSGAVLHHADLIAAALGPARLIGADLRLADLTRACFAGARLCDAAMMGADLTAADFSLADLTGADLADAIVVGTNWTGAKRNGNGRRRLFDPVGRDRCWHV